MCDQLLYCSKEIRPAKGMTERGWGLRRVQALPGSELCRFCLYAPKEIFFVSLITPGVPGPQNSGLCSLAPPLSQLCLGLRTTYMLLYDDRQIWDCVGKPCPTRSAWHACRLPFPVHVSGVSASLEGPWLAPVQHAGGSQGESARRLGKAGRRKSCPLGTGQELASSPAALPAVPSTHQDKWGFLSIMEDAWCPDRVLPELMRLLGRHSALKEAPCSGVVKHSRGKALR